MLSVTPLSPTIGGEVSGMSLADPLDDETFAALDEALLDRKVLFFRDQDITTEQHVAFGRHFGDLEIHPFIRHKEGVPEAVVLEHDEQRPGVENAWHSDVTWRVEPSLGSILRAVEVPPVGGDTLFADMEAAYEKLAPQVKERIEGLTAIHDFARVFGHGLAEDKLAELHEKYPPAEHPVVRTHPVTGRRSIYVNVAFTSHLTGVEPDESQSLLRLLQHQAWVPEYQCRFHWAKDSIAFWDNRCAQHYAVSDYWPARRVMERVTVKGDKPV